MSTETAVVKHEPEPQALQPSSFNAFGSIQNFEQAQRMAKALSSSTMVPERYRGDQNLGSCLIALEISNRIGMNVLAVMQNLYDVHGKPAWSSQFLIACVNACKKFTPLRYKMTGEKGTDTYGCIAWASDRTGERLESPEITMSIAKAEGWYQKNGSKWKTMPELMLRYRCATLFARLYAPELTMGIQTDDEVIDIGLVDTAPVITEPAIKRPSFSGPPIEPEIVPEKPKRKTHFHDTAKQVKPAPVAEPDPLDAPEAKEPEPQVDKTPEPSFEEVVDGPAAPKEPEQVVALRAAMDKAGVTEEQVIKFGVPAKWFPQDKALIGLSDILLDKCVKLTQQLGIKGSPLAASIKDAK